MSTPKFKGRRIARMTSAAAVALMLAACSSGAETPTSTGAAGLEDMENVRLVMQSLAYAPDADDAYYWTELAEAITAEFGGKIDVEVVWASGVVNVLEVDRGLADGRIDIAGFHALYKPQEYPANNAVVDSTVLRNAEPVAGAAQIQAAAAIAGFSSPEVMGEFEKQGLVVLSPVWGIDTGGMVCREKLTTLEDFEGKQIRTAGRAHSKQIEALGATPVSIVFPEVYEQLERGTVDCATGFAVSFANTGWADVAPYLIMPDDVVFAAGPAAVLGGKNVAALPDEAQRIIKEQVARFSSQFMENSFKSTMPKLQGLIEDGPGEFVQLAPEAIKAVQGANEAIRSEIAASPALDGKAYLETLDRENERWLSEAHDLGLAAGGSYADFTSWYKVDDAAWNNYQSLLASTVYGL